MSIPRETEVQCPRCGKQIPSIIFKSVNTEFEENLREKILSGEFFSTQCPSCGFLAHLEYDVLYHDLDYGAMIWIVHEENDNYQAEVDRIRANHMPIYETTRIVSNVKELCEKIYCLKACRDDRIIELSKIVLMNFVFKEYPDFIIRDTKYKYQNDSEIVTFYGVDGDIKSCFLQDEMYEHMVKLFGKYLDECRAEPFQKIDYLWAKDMLQRIPDEEI